jgi:protoporphyrinogen oxidase
MNTGENMLPAEALYMTDKPVEILIIGAGVSGLTTANRLLPVKDLLVLERSEYAGGLATQYQSGDYWFDFAGHYFHFQGKPHIKEFLENFTRFNQYKRQSKTFLLNRFIPFPVQFHLSHLPSRLRHAIYREMTEKKDSSSGAAVENLKDFLALHFGNTLLQLFFDPFLSKYYNRNLEELAANMDKGSIPVPDREQVEEGYRGSVNAKAGYNPIIYYPRNYLRGFIGNYAHPLKDRLHLNEEVKEIDVHKKQVVTEGGTYTYDKLVTTIPLNRLPYIIKPTDFFSSSGYSPNHLSHVSTQLVNVILKKRRRRFHWVYLAEKAFPFYRAGMYAGQPYPAAYLEKNVLPGTSISPAQIKSETLFTLKKLGMIHSDDELVHLDSRLLPVSYIIFDKYWQKTVPPMLDTLKEQGIFSLGRYGTWNYSSMGNDIHEAYEFAGEIINL